MAENEYGLPRDKDSFRPGSKVCDRCEDEADRLAGIRLIRVPVAAPAAVLPAPLPAADVKGLAPGRVLCKRCQTFKHLEELNKDGQCKDCKRKANQAARAQRLVRQGKPAEAPAAPEVKPPPAAESPTVAPPPIPLPQRVDAGPAVAAGPIVSSSPLPLSQEEEQMRLLGKELVALDTERYQAVEALRSSQAREVELKRKVITLEHALTASRVMYEALEERFSRHAGNPAS